MFYCNFYGSLPCNLSWFWDWKAFHYFCISSCKTGMNGMAQCPSFDATNRRFTQPTGLPANLQESLNELDHLKCSATIRIDDFEPDHHHGQDFQPFRCNSEKEFGNSTVAEKWQVGSVAWEFQVIHQSLSKSSMLPIMSYPIFGWILKLNTKTMLDLETSDSPKVGQFEKVPGHFGLGWPAKIIPLWSRCSPEAEKIATENMAPTSCRASKNQNMTEYQSMPVI